MSRARDFLCALPYAGLTSLSLLIASLIAPPHAHAFDYLEHLYLTDASCQEAVDVLLGFLERGAESEPLRERLSTRALALALSCPQRPTEGEAHSYCSEGFKLATSALTPLKEPPQESGDYSLTLGDLAALPDHIAAFGATPQLPRARALGLTTQTLAWVAQKEGGLDGTLEDVAEDACEGGDLVDWRGVDADLSRAFQGFQAHQERPQLPHVYLKARARAPLQRGPSDPAGLYSFDNPHYLDLVFRNHHHFGEHAYSAWLGFHSVSVDLAESSCESLLEPDVGVLEDLAEAWPPFDELEWGALSEQARQAEGCKLLSVIFRERLKGWSERLPPHALKRWRALAPTLLKAPSDALIKRLISATLSLVYEGGGLHFLQDSLAGGHMRTIRTRGGLQEARYDHDADNEHGVIAHHINTQSAQPFVAYGDSYLLGNGPHMRREEVREEGAPCEGEPTPKRGARCALSVQRGLLALSTVGSLIDWAHGGLLFEGERPKEGKERSEVSPEALAWVRAALPTAPPHIAPLADAPRATLRRANLPVPPPPFSYQSLSQRVEMDLAQGAPRLGVELSLLDTLGAFAHWLTSYRVGVDVTLGAEERRAWRGTLGYAFHFRWAARFTLDMGVSAQLGWRDLESPRLEGPQGDSRFFLGLSPSAGLTLLPEGWLKLPLEVKLSYQLPLTFYERGLGFPGAELIDGHYVGVALGLAFMR